MENKSIFCIKKWRQENPWTSHLYSARKRCKGIYKKRGIKCYLTVDDIKYLWFRDKAWEQDCPSIDRKDNKGDYILNNCQFIERIENTIKDLPKISPKRKIVFRYDINNKFIDKFSHAKEAEKITKIRYSNIIKCLLGYNKTAGGYKWKY